MSILVTAGPTREKIDPIRFISNYSTGTFGYEIAREAARRGWRVTLVSGPTHLGAPRGVRLIRVESALDMRRAVRTELKKCDCLVMAAAVSDWRAASPSKRKIKRRGGKMTLELTANPDILKQVSARKNKILVGFALETEDIENNAVKKLREKNLDLIIADKAGGRLDPFGSGPLGILMIDRSGSKVTVANRPKRELAKIILDKVLNINI